MKEKLSFFAFALISIVFVFEKTTAFELSPGMGYLKAQRKIICSMQDNKPIVYWWYGRMYSRVQGEKDKLLFKVEGMNIRQCDTVKDSKRGDLKATLVANRIIEALSLRACITGETNGRIELP